MLKFRKLGDSVLIGAINHIAFESYNFDETVRFYSTVLGYSVKNEIVQDGLRTVFLEKELCCDIEVIECKKPLEVGHPYGHLAFNVDNVMLVQEELARKGITIYDEYEDLPMFNTRVLKLIDPNGIIIALRQDLIQDS